MIPETDTLECVHTFDEDIERCLAGYDQISNELVFFQYNKRGDINIVDK